MSFLQKNGVCIDGRQLVGTRIQTAGQEEVKKAEYCGEIGEIVVAERRGHYKKTAQGKLRPA